MPIPNPLSIVPPTKRIVCGSQEARRRCSAWRPRGTRDWLLILTEEGRARFRFPDGELAVGRGDIVLIRPGTPHDYGMDAQHGYWKNLWVHFLPPPHFSDWMQWPEVAPGMMHFRLEPSVFRRVRNTLSLMNAATRSAGRRREELALNALERILLLCDTVNPRHAESQIDPRIRKAVDAMCETPSDSFTLEMLARRCGLSRSRLAELFKTQIGVSPLAFLESRRLHRARELVEHTSLSLAEIAEQTGFSTPFYLSLRFKKCFGRSPRFHRDAAKP